VNAHVVLYADHITKSIDLALSETKRRREMQLAFNKEHNIVPQTIIKPVREKEVDIKDVKHIPRVELPNLIIELEAAMKVAAENLDFEEAIRIRDQVNALKGRLGEV
jgi:excinuclease ABC subunit B